MPTLHEPGNGAPLHDHTLRLTTAYGELVACERVPENELPAALRRFHDRAIERANSIVELDGVAQPRNSFLEFVRAFNECAARGQRHSA